MFEVRSNTNTTLRCAFKICRQQRNSFKKIFKLLIVNSVVYIAFSRTSFFPSVLSGCNLRRFSGLQIFIFALPLGYKNITFYLKFGGRLVFVPQN